MEDRRWVYFIQRETGGPIKIGVANDISDRIGALQTSAPEKLILLASCPGGRGLEGWLHARLAAHWIRGEWFKASEAVMAEVSHARTLTQAPYKERNQAPLRFPKERKPSGSPNKFNDGFRDTLRETFVFILNASGLTNKEIARAANCGVDVVKSWRTGMRFPQTETIFALGRNCRAVAEWAMADRAKLEYLREVAAVANGTMG